MSRADTVLQIVPHLPGSFDGVGDYALNVARALFSEHSLRTTFLVAAPTSTASKEGFHVISGLSAAAVDDLAREHDHVILHYVNYGYQARGVPFSLRAFVKTLRAKLRGRWITTFHELYASGPPWRSAFWLRPFQVRIAHEMIEAANACVVSNRPIAEAIHAYDPGKKVHLVPVPSNFGELPLRELAAASAHRWAICGGTALIARSLRLFERCRTLIPPQFAPEHLDVVGGRADAAVTGLLDRLKRTLSVHHYPEVRVELASEVLRQAAFGFIDYFGAGKVWPGMVLKSTAFAAFCAHGVISVLSHQEGAILIEDDPLPGPYHLTPKTVQLPPSDQVNDIRRRCLAWYHAHASASRIARIYAEALR